MTRFLKANLFLLVLGGLGILVLNLPPALLVIALLEGRWSQAAGTGATAAGIVIVMSLLLGSPRKFLGIWAYFCLWCAISVTLAFAVIFAGMKYLPLLPVGRYGGIIGLVLFLAGTMAAVGLASVIKEAVVRLPCKVENCQGRWWIKGTYPVSFACDGCRQTFVTNIFIRHTGR